VKRLALCALVVLCSAASGNAAPAQKLKDATLYRVELKGTATVTAIGNTDGSNYVTRYNQSTLTASWTFEPKPTKLWLANVDTGTYETKAKAPDLEDNTGAISAQESFTWFDKNDKSLTPHKGDSDCHGQVKNQIQVLYTAEATKGGVNLDADLTGIFRTNDGAQVDCVNNPPKGGDVVGQFTPNSAFAFTWDPTQEQGARASSADPANQRMQLFDTLQRFQIGTRSPGTILKDGSQVTDALNCSNLFLESCSVQFKLNGELTLTRICSGVLGSDGGLTCKGKSGGSGTTPGKGKGGGGKPGGPPKLTNLEVGGGKIMYTVDQVPSKTQLEVVGKLTVAGHTLGPLPVWAETRTNTSKSMSVPFHPTFAGKPLPAGTYTLKALPFTASAPGRSVSTTFVVK
jgi:hypothetical protein